MLLLVRVTGAAVIAHPFFRRHIFSLRNPEAFRRSLPPLTGTKRTLSNSNSKRRVPEKRVSGRKYRDL